MENAYVFVDETGKSDFSHDSKYFCLSAIVINERNREKLKSAIENLKQKYFGSKHYVLHGSELKRKLKICKKNEVILEKSYSMILSNLIKFVVAKDFKGQIIAEASAHEQDLHLYLNFFKFMGNGIPRLNISPKDVKSHVTSITYVTKQNEDCETQLVDLLAGVIPIKHELMRKHKELHEVSGYDQEILKILDRKLFVVNANAQDRRKKVLYSAITSYKKFP